MKGTEKTTRRTTLKRGAIAASGLAVGAAAMSGSAAAKHEKGGGGKKKKKKGRCQGLLTAAAKQDKIGDRHAKRGDKKKANHHWNLADKLRTQYRECLQKGKKKKAKK